MCVCVCIRVCSLPEDFFDKSVPQQEDEEEEGGAGGGGGGDAEEMETEILGGAAGGGGEGRGEGGVQDNAQSMDIL